MQMREQTKIEQLKALLADVALLTPITKPT